MHTVWTRRATSHLQAAYQYWFHEKSEEAADIMLDRIFKGVELLDRNPELGRPGRIPGTRELVLRPLPFVLAYRIRRNNIEVLAILHGARKWPGQF
jgi:plasmid stabilization system protein ParE